MKTTNEVDLKLPNDFYQLFSKKLIESQDYTSVQLGRDSLEIKDSIFSSNASAESIITDQGRGPFYGYTDGNIRFFLPLEISNHFWGKNHPLIIKYDIIKNSTKATLRNSIEINHFNFPLSKIFKYFQPLSSNLTCSSLNIYSSTQLALNQFTQGDCLKLNNSDHQVRVILDQSDLFATSIDANLFYASDYLDQVDGVLIGNQLLKSGVFLKEKINFSEATNSCYNMADHFFFEKSFDLLTKTSILNQGGKIDQIQGALKAQLKSIKREKKFSGLLGLIHTGTSTLEIARKLFSRGIHLSTFATYGTIGFRLPVNIKLNEIEDLCKILISVIGK